jgi:hypothetical protein
MDQAALVNFGLIRKGSPQAENDAGTRTIIVTGLGRSGTSMIAALLAEMGILSREQAYETTFDDREFLHLLKFRDYGGLQAAIRARNQVSTLWAFKIPSLHGFLEPQQLRMFSNPRLVVVFRNPVAVAERHALAEYAEPVESFFEAVIGVCSLTSFIQAADCPALLVSYEKALSFPDQLVTALAEFCCVTLDGSRRERVRAMIRPNDTDYARTARRQYDGNIDGIFEGAVIGWCREIGEAGPVEVDLLVDGIVRLSATADGFRDDLQQAGIGDGRHAFGISTYGLDIKPSSIMSVRVSGRSFEVPGSGKRVWEYWR